MEARSTEVYVEEEIRMHMAYDWFIDENPDVKERIVKGEEREELRALRQILIDMVNNRFPSLAQLAQQKVTSIQKPDFLRQLVLQISSASDETIAQQLLDAVEVQ